MCPHEVTKMCFLLIIVLYCTSISIRVHIKISPGDTVQVNSPPECSDEWRGSPCVIDSSNCGNVIVSPDLLITPTAIATSVTCPRRYVTYMCVYYVLSTSITDCDWNAV